MIKNIFSLLVVIISVINLGNRANLRSFNQFIYNQTSNYINLTVSQSAQGTQVGSPLPSPLQSIIKSKQMYLEELIKKLKFNQLNNF